MSKNKSPNPADSKPFESEFLTHQRVRLEELLRMLLPSDGGSGRALPKQHAESRFRLGDVVRSLKKLDIGTYGISDYSGRPISRHHLEAVPEATLTIEEAASRDRFEED